MSAESRAVFTIGHSTHELGELIALLSRHGVACLADVRTVPRSRRVPQFNDDALPGPLADAGIAYRRIPELGGWRKAASGSPNTGWETEGFRGYADHMASEEFARGIAELTVLARERPVACMCAEGLWWRCHRRLISDALAVRGWRVLHILPSGEIQDHPLTPFAVVDGHRITYPAAQSHLDL